MAPLQETVTVAKHGHGAVIVTWSSGPTLRITKFEVEDLDGQWMEIEGGNVNQVVDFIETHKGKGKVKLTTDEVFDVDASANRGKVTTLTLGQPFPLASSKKWEMAAGFALVRPKKISGGRAGEKTMTEIEIQPYHATVGSAMWTFNHDAADS